MQILQWFVDLGASVMLPIIFFIFALILRTGIKKAFHSGITVGVGFVGVNLILDLLTESLGPAAQSMVHHFGMDLQMIDVGWPAASAISYGTVLGSLAIPISIGVNLLLLTIGLTKTVNVDIWNYWHMAFTGSLVYAITNDFTLGILTIGVHAIVVLLAGDLLADDVESYFGYQKMTFPHAASAPSYFLAKPMNALFDRIPKFNQIQANPETIQRRFGLFGDSTMLGALLGLLIGLLAGYNVQETLQLSVQTAAVMLLLPKMVALLMEGLTPVSEAASNRIKKRFPDRDLYIGMDSALTIGHPAVLSASLLMVPITLAMAVILPGNRVLPFGDLASLPFLFCLMVPVFRGNIIRTVITATIYIGVGLYIATWIAPLFTEMAINADFDTGTNTIISSLIDGAVWTTFIFTGSGQWLGWFGIGLIGIMAFAGLLYIHKWKRKENNR
ncbi:PTS galactitol transporter subunit IIC [Lentibacillus sp. CBA3610]|uniref:PTS galactitol transporter subunit IIC n=1 Tax=Lentibacillus sp. CBA3610 TaxID=2518176 RepID=UPI0015962FF6|nr:PTS transporter subunit IIC [Lentibacillus sp. CBA3610]QKY69712.1 PTS galactitol transporter subunit IIC [Lentibacillus sp. CBA3610]